MRSMVPRTEMMMRKILMGAEMMMRMVTRREMMMMRMVMLMGAEREEEQLLAEIKLNDCAQQQDSNMRCKSRNLMVMMTTLTKDSIKVDDNGNKSF